MIAALDPPGHFNEGMRKLRAAIGAHEYAITSGDLEAHFAAHSLIVDVLRHLETSMEWS